MTQTEYLRVTDELEDIYYIEVNYPNGKRDLIEKLISFAIEELTGSDNWCSYDSGTGNDMDAFVGWTNQGIIFERYENAETLVKDFENYLFGGEHKDYDTTN